MTYQPHEYHARLELPDGRIAYAVPQLFGSMIALATVEGDRRGISDELYHYEEPGGAVDALHAWEYMDFDDEPEGWVRHKPSNRRREHGDPARETVRE